MEFKIIAMMFEDKEIVNPKNTEEIFTCSDLVGDLKKCMKEVTMQTVKGEKV